MAYFPKYNKFFNLQKTPKLLEIWTKLWMSKVVETFNISEVFKYFMFGQVVLHYIHQENLWLEQKWVNRGNFSVGGKLSLQKLCRNKAAFIMYWNQGPDEITCKFEEFSHPPKNILKILCLPLENDRNFQIPF